MDTIILLLGFVALAKGFPYLFFPKQARAKIKKWLKYDNSVYRVYGGIACALGLGILFSGVVLKMEAINAIKTAETNQEVQSLLKQGYYLSSLMAIPETLNEITHWTLVYFNPTTQQVFSVEVTPTSTKIGSPSKPLVLSHYAKLNYSNALNTAGLLDKIKMVLAKQKEFPTKTIITLRESEWKIAVTTQSLKMLRLDLEMETGETKSLSQTSLIKTA